MRTAAIMIFLAAPAYADLPSSLNCTFQAFLGDGLVTSEFRLIESAYVDVDGDGASGLVYQVIGQTNVALHLVHAAGGAVTTVIVERSTGEMLKVSAATFGDVQSRRGICSLSW